MEIYLSNPGLSALSNFINGFITTENAEQIYNVLKGSLDEEGFILYKAAREILQCDVFSRFIVEDSLGWFEEADGYKLKKYAEIACFGICEYEGDLHGAYQILKGFEMDTASPDYLAYQKALWPRAVANCLQSRISFEDLKQLPDMVTQLLAIKNSWGKYKL